MKWWVGQLLGCDCNSYKSNVWQCCTLMFNCIYMITFLSISYKGQMQNRKLAISLTLTPLFYVHAKPSPGSDFRHCNTISVIFLSSNYIPLGKASQLNKRLYFDIHNYTHSHKAPFQVRYVFYYTLIVCDEIMHSVGLDWVRVHLIK